MAVWRTLQRRRIDVNPEEPSRIIARGMRAPLSESDGRKPRIALYAMAERLCGKRSTADKTSAVAPPDASPAPIQMCDALSRTAWRRKRGCISIGSMARLDDRIKEKFRGNECGPAWPTLERTASDWDGQRRQAARR